MYTGPKLHNDNLAFGYDTGYGLDQHSSTRHYKGEPATNVITAGIPGYFGSGGETLYRDNYLGLNSDSGVFQRNFVNNPAQANTSAYNNNAGIYHSGLTFSSLSSNTEYILISFDFYMIDNYVRHSSSSQGLNGYMRVVYTDGSGDNIGWNTSLNTPNAGDDWNNNSAYIGQWRKIALYVQVNSSKTPSSISAMYIYNDRTIKGEGVFTNFIITEHVTAPTGPVLYTSGTRSDTASLIDLKKTTDIDVGNVSFGSTGQPTFDGTDDKIVIPNKTSIGSYTYETVVKINSSDTSYSGFGSNFKSDASGYSGVGNGWVVRLDPNGALQVYTKNNSTTLINPINISGFRAANVNNYIHLVYTYSSGSNKLYVDGVLQATGTALSGATPSDSTLIIGAYSWGISSQTYYINAHQPVAKLYSETLTATEIKSNFNAYKNRFNI